MTVSYVLDRLNLIQDTVPYLLDGWNRMHDTVPYLLDGLNLVHDTALYSRRVEHRCMTLCLISIDDGTWCMTLPHILGVSNFMHYTASSPRWVEPNA